ncbi:MAG: ActS/PrrB/RegB family redox-sensitive histidine kinase, partial [Pseudomonadota bacterium]
MSDTTPIKRVDDALFGLIPKGIGGVGAALGRTRLRTFIGLRWIAVVGQTLAVLLVAFGFNFNIDVARCLAVISSSAWLNVFLTIAFPSQRLATEREAGLQLAFDVLQLGVLIALTGGLSNPFLLLLVAPVTVAAATLKPHYTALLAIVVLGISGAMPLFSSPLPWFEGQEIVLPPLLQWGQYAALAVGLLFLSVSALRVSQDEARLIRALDAAQVVMAREQRLSALGALAAMTAHELGTPLATIHLVAKEMLRDLDPEDPLNEDMRLLVEQAERCRGILGSLGQRREAGDIIHAQMPLSAVIEEAAAPHKGLGVAVRVLWAAGVGGEDKAPTVRRSPEVLHALGAFIENAVSFAETEVSVSAQWTDDEITISVRDDGPGFSPEVLPKLGEPYVSKRSEAQMGGGDMGLGFFIAKTLIERTGGRIATRNRTPPNRGAVVQAVWPRAALESEKSVLSA